MRQQPGLSGIQRAATTITIAATTTVAELEHVSEPLATASHFVADPEIRAQATLGGNLCTVGDGEHPRGDLQAAVIALGGRVRSAGKDGERVDSVEDLLASGLGERLVLEVEFDEPRRSGHAAVRRPHAHAYTILAVCVAETADGIRVGLSGAGPHGIRARSVEDALANGDGADEAAQKVLDDAELHDDALASAWYRGRMLPLLVRRALDDLADGSSVGDRGEGKGNAR